jgi:hypothetical protein
LTIPDTFIGKKIEVIAIKIEDEEESADDKNKTV